MVRETYNKICFGQIPETQQLREDNTTKRNQFKRSTDDVSSQNFSDRNSGFYERNSRLVYDSDNYIRRTQNNNNNNNTSNNNSYNPQVTSITTSTGTSSPAASTGASSRAGGREHRDCLFGNRNGPFSSGNILSERTANSNTNSPSHHHNNRVPSSSSATWYDIVTTSTNGPGGSGSVGASIATGGSINSHHNQHHHYYTNIINATTVANSSSSSSTSISLTTPPASSTLLTTSATITTSTATLTSLGSAIYQRGSSHDSGINKQTRSKLNKLLRASSAGTQSGAESPSSATATSPTVTVATSTSTTTSFSNSSCSTISSSNNNNLSSSSNSTTFNSSGIVSNSILNAMTSATVAAVSSSSTNSGYCGETTAAAATTANTSYTSSSSSINPSANASNTNSNNNATSYSATRATRARCTTSSSRSHSRSPSSYSSSHSSSSSSHASSHSHASSPVLGIDTGASSTRGVSVGIRMQPAVATPTQGSTSNNPSGGGACSSSSSSSSSSGSCPTVSNPVVHSEDNRPLAIRVRNLPARSSDTSLKDGLFHEYKKHGKVTWVKVVGQNSERYALVCFKKPEDVEKALEVSHDKLFFGCKIEVEPYQGYDVEDNEFRPYEAELDEYHPKSTRTLFIGNLEKDITASELRSHFEGFGEIIEIDIKKQGMNAYAFCQYSDIVSVVKAMRKMDGEHLGNNRIKLGFGKSMPTNCVWIDGIGEKISESHLQSQFSRYGTVTKVIVDRVRQLALVLYEQIQYAQTAVKEMRGTTLRGRRLQVDFASRECQDAFYEKLDKQNTAGRFSRYESQSRSRASSFSRHQNSNDGCSPSNTPGSSSGSSASGVAPPALSSAIVSGANSLSAGNSATPAAGNSNLSSVVSQTISLSSTGNITPARSRAMRSMRSHTIDYDYADVRRFRAYDEYSQGSAASHDEDANGGAPLTPIHSAFTSGVANSSLRSDSPLLSRLGPIVGSAAAIVSGNETFEVTLSSGRRRCDKSPGKQKGDIRVLQKERFHLLEQLEECPSSGDENIASPRKRIKIDHHHSSNISSGLDASSIGETQRSNLNSNCDSIPHDPTLHRKGDVRRFSDFGKYHLQPPHQQQQLHHHQQHLSRRPSNDLSATISSAAADHTSIRHNSTSSSSSEHYGQHQIHGTIPCKRRRVISGNIGTNCNSTLSTTAVLGGGSTGLSGAQNSTANDEYHHHASRGRGHQLHSHHSHEASCGESADGSRPGTPLCDERPEVLPTEPRRVPRERPHEPMVLPLPKFGIQFFQQFRNSGGCLTSNVTSAYHHHSGNSSTSLANAHINYGLSNSHLGGNNGCSGHSSLNHNVTSLSSASGGPHLPSPSSRYPPWRPHHHPHHHHRELTTSCASSSTTSASVVSPLRPRSLSSNSSDSDVQAHSSGSPSLEERIRTLDEMYERWSGGSAASSAAIKRHDFGHGNTPSWQIQREHSSSTLNMPTGTGNSASTMAPSTRHKFLDLDVNELQPSEIVKSVLAKKSLFDDDLQRLKKNQWLEPAPADLVLNANPVSTGLPNLGAATKSPVVGSTNSSSTLSRPGALIQRLNSLSPMNSPQASMSPYNSPSPSPSVSCSITTSSVQKQLSTAPSTTSIVPVTPTATVATSSSTTTKGLQYPFPSHPPLPSTAAPGPVAQPPPPAEQSKLPPMPTEQPPPPPIQSEAHIESNKHKQNITKSLSVPMNSSNQVEKSTVLSSVAADAARTLIKSVSVPGSTNIGTVKMLPSTPKSSPEQVTTSGNSSSTTSSTSNKPESDNTKPSKSLTTAATTQATAASTVPAKKNEKSHKHTHRNDGEKKTKHERATEKRKKSLTSTPRVEGESSDSDDGKKSYEKCVPLVAADKEKTEQENIEKEKLHQQQQRDKERQEREKRDRELKKQQEKDEKERKEREDREKRENEDRERSAKIEKERLEREREESERRLKDENDRRECEENIRKQQKSDQERQERERRVKAEKECIELEELRQKRCNQIDTEKSELKTDLSKAVKDGVGQSSPCGANIQRPPNTQIMSDIDNQANKDNAANIETSINISLTNKHHYSGRKSSRNSPIRHPKRRLSSQDNTSVISAAESHYSDENAKRMRVEGQDLHGNATGTTNNVNSTKDKDNHTKDLAHRSSNKHHHHQRQHSSSSHKSEHAVSSASMSGSSNVEKSKTKDHHSSKYKSKHHNKSASQGPHSNTSQNQNQHHNVSINDSNTLIESEGVVTTSAQKSQSAAEPILTAKINLQHEDISDQEHENAPQVGKSNISDDDEESHAVQIQHEQLPKTPSHSGHNNQHRHREHHSSSSRHKSKREHRDKKRHSIAESSTGNAMTDEEVGTSSTVLAIHRRISAGGSTTSDTTTPTTRETKTKSSDHLLASKTQSGERKLSRSSEDGNNILPNTPTCRLSVTKSTSSRKMIMSSADSDDSEDTAAAKKRSIFDIPDDGPYVSMYDKVKARSCKNMQKQEEEKKIKAKFSQLKQSRAKREEKKRSASYDGDSDSDFDEQVNHRIAGDSGSYKSRNHGGLTSSSDGGAVDDDDDDESILARRRSSQASSSHRKLSDSDSTAAAELAEDAARRIRTHENLMRLCDGEDTSDEEIRCNLKRSSPNKRSKTIKRTTHAIQRIVSDSESLSQPPSNMDVKIKLEVKHSDENIEHSFENENKLKEHIKKEPQTAVESSVGSDIEQKIKRRSSISSGEDQQITTPLNIKMEPGKSGNNLLSTDEIKKEYTDFFGKSYEYNLPEHKVKELIQQQVHYSPDCNRKKHKKSKKRQKGGITIMQDIDNVASLQPITSNALDTETTIISGSSIPTNVSMNTTKESCFDVFDELKRQDSVIYETTAPSPTVDAKNGNVNDFIAINNSDKKRHKERKEKKREKLRSVGGGEISNTASGMLTSASVDLDKLSKEERHRLKKSKKSKSLELVRSVHTPTTSASVNISPSSASATLKHIEGKMEDIFGPISDEESQFSDIVCKEFSPSSMKLGDPCASTPTSSNITGPIVSAAVNPYKQEPLTPKSHTVEENEENILKVSSIGDGSSPGGVGSISVSQSERERLRKEKREKKRRDREKSREQHALSALQQQKHHECLDDENSVDLDEAGRALEAQLMEDSDNKMTEDATPSTATTYRSDMTDVFRFSDGDENSVEFLQSSSSNKKDGVLSHIMGSALVQNMQQQQPIIKSKEKKKKKKRSKEEKHHHQRRESSCSSNASTSTSHHVQSLTQQTSSVTTMMSPPPPNSVTSIGKLTIDILAASKHSPAAVVDEEDSLSSLPICKPSPSLPCLIGGDDDDDISICQPKATCKSIVSPSVSEVAVQQKCTESLSLSPIREKQMISPIPKTPTITNAPKGKDDSVPIPLTPKSAENSLLIKPPSSTTPTVPENVPTTSPVSSALSPGSVHSNTIGQKKKPEKFIPGFDGELDDKISESAVQSISAELNATILDPSADEPKIPIQSPPDASKHLEKIEDSKSRVQISQEETESAVSALLGESFGNSSTADFDTYNDVGCLDDLAVPTVVGGVDEEAAIAARAIEGTLKEPILQSEEDREEVSMAVQSLSSVVDISDIKPPDTPQSDRGLQIDTDTEDTNADEADSSGNSLKIDETATTPPREVVSPKLENKILLSESVDSLSPSLLSSASVITKVERIETSSLSGNTDASNDKSAVKENNSLKSEIESQISKNETLATKMETSSLPSMVCLEEPLRGVVTATSGTSNNTLLTTSTPIKTTPLSKMATCSPQVEKHNNQFTQPDVQYMQPPIISIPEVPAQFAVPQMSISPRSTASHDRCNLSPRQVNVQSPKPITTNLQSPKPTAQGSTILPIISIGGVSASTHKNIPSNAPSVGTVSTQHSPSNQLVAEPKSPSSQNRSQQTQQIQKCLPISQSSSNSTLTNPSIAQQPVQPPCTSHNSKNNVNSIPQSPIMERPTIEIQNVLKVANTSSPSGTNLPSPTTRPPQMRVGQSCQIAKTVIEHGSVQQQLQHGPMSITLQKMPPVTSHPTIISKVVNVQPQQAQRLPSPTRVLHSSISQHQQTQQQQPQLGHLLPISTVPKTITNPYHQQQKQQQQQQHEQLYAQSQPQHHMLQPRSTSIQKVQQSSQKLQQHQSITSPLGISCSDNSSMPTNKLSTSGDKPTVMIGNQSPQKGLYFHQQPQQNQQSITSNMSIALPQHHQQQKQQPANSVVPQGIIVQQQIVSRPLQASDSQKTPAVTAKLTSHLGNNSFVSKQTNPSIVIEPISMPNTNKESEKLATTVSTTTTTMTTNTMPPSTSMQSIILQASTVTTKASLIEKPSSPSNKVAENVSVIRNPSTPSPKNRRNSVLPNETESSPAFEINTTTSITNPSTPLEVSISSKEQNCDQQSLSQSSVKDINPSDSVIKKTDKTEDVQPPALPTSTSVPDTTACTTNSSSTIKEPISVKDTIRAESNKETATTNEVVATSSTDHDTEDETETKQSTTPNPIKSTGTLNVPAFEKIPSSNSTNTQINVTKAIRGGGAKRGRQPRGGKKSAAGIPASSSTIPSVSTESDSGIQTRLRKPMAVSTVTRGRKGRPPRNALLAQRTVQQQQQQQQQQNEFDQQQQQQMHQPTQVSNTVPLTKSSISTSVEKKERSQTFSATPMTSTATSTSSDQDVYEFHDDSAEETKGKSSADSANEDARPRLILTIKSPGHATSAAKIAEKSLQAAVDPLATSTVHSNRPTETQSHVGDPNVGSEKQMSDVSTTSQESDHLQPTTTSAVTHQQQQQQHQDEQTHFNTAAVSTASNTRKSRRLQEKDRSTIDDIIEDVVRNTQTPPPASLPLPKGAQTPPRRSGRNVAGNPKKNETPALALPNTPNAVGRPRRSKDRKNGTESSSDNTNVNPTEPQSPKPPSQQTSIQQANTASPSISKSKNAAVENSPTTQPVEETSPITQHSNSGEVVPTEVSLNQSQSILAPPAQHPPNLLSQAVTQQQHQHHPQHPKKKAIAAAEIESYVAAAAAASVMNNNQSSISALPPGGLPMLHTAAPGTQKITGGTADAVNKSLIDPVTGLISGMQQGKEGNLPMATAAIKKILPGDNVIHQQPQITDSVRSSPPIIHKLPPCTTATALNAPPLNQVVNIPPQSQVCSIATPITALTKPVQAEAAASATTLTVPASLANKPVSVVVKTSTVPPVVIQQQIVQPTTQQGTSTPTKQPIMVQQSQLLMHAQHTNVRPPTLKAHVLNSQKQLQQHATITPIPSSNQPGQSQHQQKHSTIVIGGNNTTATGGPAVSSANSVGHHVIQSNIVARHNVQIPTTSTSAVLQHQQLLVNIPSALSPHSVSATTQANLVNSPRVQPQQTLVIKQGGTQIPPQQPSQAAQILHVVTSKANVTGGLTQQQHQNIYSVSQQQHSYMPNSAPGIKPQQQQQQQITVLPVEHAQHHAKQQQQQQQNLHHVTIQQKQMQPQTMGVSIVAHQQPVPTTLSTKQPQQTLILPTGMSSLSMPSHPNIVLQTKQLSTAAMSTHLQAQQLTSSPPATTIGKQNPTVHNLQTQSTTPHMSSSPPTALKLQQQLSQQPQTSMLAGTPTNLRTAIPSMSPQGQARVTPLLLPTGMPVTIFEPNMGDSAFSTGALRGVPPPRESFMIYQQLLRSQETMNASIRCANDYEEKLLGSSPPLELRRPGSVPRAITVPHSLQSPQDRTSDSPQAAQIYVHNSRIPHPHYPPDVAGSRGFYEASGRQITIEPPPAHRPATGSSPFMGTPPAVHPAPPPSTPTAVTTAPTVTHMHAGNLIDREREREREQQDRLKSTGGTTGHDNMIISATMSTPPGRNMQVATPPHGNQVPPPQPNADSLLTLLQRYPVMWQGLLALKTDQAAVQMHFVFGNPHVARASLPCNSDGSTPPLRIAQRMRLEQTQLEGVAKKMQYENEHCMLLALPCGRDHADVLQHSRNLQTGFITYLQQKMAAGIVNIPVPGSEQAAYVVHIFPSCDFANENLERAAPDLKNRVAEIAHLLIVIATV